MAVDPLFSDVLVQSSLTDLTDVKGGTISPLRSPILSLDGMTLSGTNGATMAHSSIFEPGVGDYTAEAEIYLTSGTTAWQGIFAHSAAGTACGWQLSISNQRLTLELANGTLSRSTSGTTVFYANRWYQVAMSKKGNVWYILVNGVIEATLTSTWTIAQSVTMYIGIDRLATSYGLIGTMRNIRITRSCRYEPSEESVTFDPFRKAVAFHWRANESGTDMIDTAKNLSRVVAGTWAVIGTGAAPADTTLYDGLPTYTFYSYANNHYYDAVPSAINEFNFGTKDVCIDFWARVNANGNNMFLSSWRPTLATGSWSLYAGSTGALVMDYWDTAVRTVSTSAGVFSPGVWHHVAIQRKEGILEVYLDGILVLSPAYPLNYAFGRSNNLRIASHDNVTPPTSWWLLGRMTDVRITMAIRYTGNFTVRTYPPTLNNPAAIQRSGMALGSGTIAGVIKDETGAPCERRVMAYNRSTGQLIATTTSNPTTGAYEFQLSNSELFIVALDDEDGSILNPVAIDRVVPT